MLLTLITFGQSIDEKVNRFRSIKIDVPAETQVVFGSEHRIQITGPNKILDKLEFYVRGNTLVVRSKKKNLFNWWNSGTSSREVQIKITANTLDAAEFNASGIAEIDRFESERFQLEVNGSTDIEVAGAFEDFELNIDGSGDVRAEDLKSDKIDIHINGSGSARLDGKANRISMNINGSGDIYAINLECKRAKVHINGSGDVKIHAIDELDVSIMGSGDVTYKGNPEIDDRVMGSGDVRKY